MGGCSRDRVTPALWCVVLLDRYLGIVRSRGRYGAWEWLQARSEWLAARKEMLDDAELLHTTLSELERVTGLALFALTERPDLAETDFSGAAP